jgi:hypothetical protein
VTTTDGAVYCFRAHADDSGEILDADIHSA